MNHNTPMAANLLRGAELPPYNHQEALDSSDRSEGDVHVGWSCFPDDTGRMVWTVDFD